MTFWENNMIMKCLCIASQFKIERLFTFLLKQEKMTIIMSIADDKPEERSEPIE